MGGPFGEKPAVSAPAPPHTPYLFPQVGVPVVDTITARTRPIISESATVRCARGGFSGSG